LLLGLLFVGLGIFLLFDRLDWNGFTWDELADYQIAWDVAQSGNVFDNELDPSQGRLSHLWGALFLRALGPALYSFKLAFALVGLAGGVLLFHLLRQRFSTGTAILLAGFYGCCPYVLGASRSGATAGDITVAVLWLAFIGSVVVWWERRAFWPSGLLCAVVTGLAIGAKWSSAVLLIVPIFGLCYHTRPWNRARISSVGRGYLGYLAVTAMVALVANPLFLLGPEWILDAWAEARIFDDRPHAFFGVWSTGPPWYYVPALLASKLTVPFLVFFVVALGLELSRVWARRRIEPLLLASLLCLGLGIGEFALKPFQNAHYYVTAIGPTMLIAGALLDDLRARPEERWRVLGLTSFAAVLACAAVLSWRLAPDYLQAGREFGPRFQGEFAGPAVNHCQGGPLAIQAVNALQVSRPRLSAYLFEDDCLGVINFDHTFGPWNAQLEIRSYDLEHPPTRPHVLLISRLYQVYSASPDEAAPKRTRIARATQGCTAVPYDSDAYTIFLCDREGADR
jgi:hypothetical protein